MMAVEKRATANDERTFAPYAPAATVLKVIRHFRNRDVPEHLTPMMLAQIEVTEALVPRVIRALEFLGLIDETFESTPEFRSLPKASDEEYRKLLAGLIRNAYREIFRIVEVENAAVESLQNAFRPYSPAGQRTRMAILFVELCREAGMRVSGSETEPRVTAPRIIIRRGPRPARSPMASTRTVDTEGDSIPPTIRALLNSLPDPKAGWTTEERDRWLNAFRAMIDYLFPISNKEGENES